MSDGNKVLDALKLRLETIRKENGFAVNVEFVDRQFKWPDEIGQRFPALLVIPGSVMPLDRGLQSNRQVVDRGVSVFCYVYEQHKPSTVLEDLQAEVLKAVFSEPVNLGGVVFGLRWTGADSSASAFSVVGFNVGYAPPIGVARLDFIFRHEQNLIGGV
jgi:hypothetical protein